MTDKQWIPPAPAIFKYDEKNKPESYAAYTVQQLHDAHAAGRAELFDENTALRNILVNAVAALESGAGVSQNSSIEFLSDVPKEVRATVKTLRDAVSDARHGHLSDDAGAALNARFDTMAGLRGMGIEDAEQLVRRCMEQAGIPTDEQGDIQSLGWNLCYRVANEAHKAGARDMNVLIAGGKADPFVWIWKSLGRDVRQAQHELASKGLRASFLDWIVQVSGARAEMAVEPLQRMRREDGWYSDDGGLSWRDPAPHAAQPMVASETVIVTVGWQGKE